MIWRRFQQLRRKNFGVLFLLGFVGGRKLEEERCAVCFKEGVVVDLLFLIFVCFGGRK